MNAVRVVLALLGVTLTAAMPFVTASCGKKACFRWTEAEGACPSQEEAQAYLAGAPRCGPDNLTVDSEAEYDGELCCYDVTGGDTGDELCPPTPGAVGPSSSTVGAGPSTSSAVTTGTGSCDGTGDCGDAASGGCVACAVNTLCSVELDACLSEASCSDFVACMDACGPDQACIDACAVQNPQGAQLYNALFDCILCTVCPIDCANSMYVDPIPGCQ